MSHFSAGVQGFLETVGISLLAAIMLAAPPFVDRALAQAALTAAITSPVPDESLKGTVQIVGTADAAAFASAELAFAYANDPTSTWFIIQTLDQPVVDSEIATWDTAAISDGEYQLRLRVYASDATFQDATVAIQIRNYTSPPAILPTAALTATPGLEISGPMVLVASETPAPSAPSTPTAFPPNPAGATVGGIYRGFWQGALVVLGLFAVVGILLLRRRP